MTSFIVTGKWATKVGIRFFEGFAPLVRGIESLEPRHHETIRVFVDVTNDQKEGVRKLLQAHVQSWGPIEFFDDDYEKFGTPWV